MSPEKSIYRIRNLLASDRIKESIDELLFYFKEDGIYKDLILHSANFTRLERDFSRGLIDWDKATQSKNRIILAILDILDEIGPTEVGVYHQMQESNLKVKFENLDLLLVRKKGDDNIHKLIFEATKIASHELKNNVLKSTRAVLIGRWIVVDIKNNTEKKVQQTEELDEHLNSSQLVELFEKIYNEDKMFMSFQFNLVGKSKMRLVPKEDNIIQEEIIIPYTYKFKGSVLTFNLNWKSFNVTNLTFQVKINQRKETVAFLESSLMSIMMIKI